MRPTPLDSNDWVIALHVLEAAGENRLSFHVSGKTVSFLLSQGPYGMPSSMWWRRSLGCIMRGIFTANDSRVCETPLGFLPYPKRRSCNDETLLVVDCSGVLAANVG